MYIKRNRAKEVLGGIAIFDDEKWLDNDSEKYKYDEHDLSGWMELNLGYL